MTISMTWPQYLRRECVCNNRLVELPGYEADIMLLLLLKGRATWDDIIEWLWPDPDTQPLTAKNVAAQYLVRMRKKIDDQIVSNRTLNGLELKQVAKLDPWHYASKTRTEHAEQVALFMWANMAKLFGPEVANDPDSYNVKGHANEAFHAIQSGEGRDPRLPQLKWLHAVHNQGHGDAVRGSNAKAEGVKAGVADVFLPVAARNTGLISPNQLQYFCGLYIELKKKDSGTPSDIQLEFQRDMQLAGYKAEIIHGWELARDEILRYLDVS